MQVHAPQLRALATVKVLLCARACVCRKTSHEVHGDDLEQKGALLGTAEDKGPADTNSTKGSNETDAQLNVSLRLAGPEKPRNVAHACQPRSILADMASSNFVRCMMLDRDVIREELPTLRAMWVA